MKFISIKWKNFLSYGNTWTKIRLDTNKMVNIIGKNGHGKSVLIDAFHYAMTGKPFRKIKMSTLQNFINEQNLIVELEVERGSNHFLIKRGMNPKVFEIVKNGVPQDEESRIGDQQQTLENLLHFNSKTLRFTMIMSSMKYTPFLQMSAADKREFIDEILDVSIFTNLGTYIKKKNTVLKEKLTKTEYNVKNLESQLDLIREMNSKVINNADEQIVMVKDKIKELKKKCKSLTTEINEHKNNESLLDKEIEKLNYELNKIVDEIKKSQKKIELEITKKYDLIISELETEKKKKYDKANKQGEEQEKNITSKKKSLLEKIKNLKNEKHKKENELSEKKNDLNSQVKIIEKDKTNLDKKRMFLTNNSQCPTCERKIDDEFKNSAMNDIDEEDSKLDDKKNSLLAQIKSLFSIEEDIKEQEKKLSELDIKKTKFEENEKIFLRKFHNILVDINNKYNEKINVANNEKRESLNEHNKETIRKTDKKRNDITPVLSTKTEERSNIREKLRELKANLNNNNNVIADHEDQIKRLKSGDNEIKDETEVLNDLNKQRKLLENQTYKKKIFQSAIMLLSDKGFKTIVIKKYIPLLNKYVNKYLEALEAHYRLKFDEKFDVQIVERGYEKLSYENFSSGEAARCDIALLFGFLDLAKKKNSIESNLLILDEVADSSLDKSGVFGLINLISQLKLAGNTVYVISHRNEIQSMFDETYEAVKGRFSNLEVCEE